MIDFAAIDRAQSWLEGFLAARCPELPEHQRATLARAYLLRRLLG